MSSNRKMVNRSLNLDKEAEKVLQEAENKVAGFGIDIMNGIPDAIVKAVEAIAEEKADSKEVQEAIKEAAENKSIIPKVNIKELKGFKIKRGGNIPVQAVPDIQEAVPVPVPFLAVPPGAVEYREVRIIITASIQGQTVTKQFQNEQEFGEWFILMFSRGEQFGILDIQRGYSDFDRNMKYLTREKQGGRNNARSSRI